MVEEIKGDDENQDVERMLAQMVHKISDTIAQPYIPIVIQDLERDEDFGMTPKVKI